MKFILRNKFLLKSRRMAKHIVADTRGVTTIEFAILSPIFFSLILSVFELSLVFLKVVLIDMAATEVSRYIYIGSASTGAVTMEELEDKICDRVSLIDFNCKDNLTLELTTITDFHSIPTSNAKCADSDAAIKPAVNFNPGITNELVYMRICLTTNVYTPGIGLGLSFPKTDTGKIQIVSALAFSNEPF